MASIPNIPSKIESITKQGNFGNPMLQSIMLVIVLVLFSWFILRPKLTSFIQLRSDYSTAKEQLTKVEKDQQDMNLLVNKLHSSPDEVALVDEALPLNGRISKVDYLLDNMVRQSGMTMTVVSADDTQKIVSAGDKQILANPFQPGRTLHTITVNTTITGTMEQLKNLLQLIETNGRVFDVDSLQVLGGDPITKFKLTVKAYAYESVTK